MVTRENYLCNNSYHDYKGWSDHVWTVCITCSKTSGYNDQVTEFRCLIDLLKVIYE